ncbi:pentapeptide repeat-containing protein [Actinokineospora fastidiosa]|uniref:Pentapeptide repeat-containing protein n=1 Tax=Actinokineospora fastidiosa TaxID=1816 RepID=A0A918GDE9_9PSEU|nr:pentapeptide repeat-containing protein [Actinokineospora fastidiosa]GGS29540.1 hypothetical protein GCM10010171_23560 [Actinokineospora fastidiosa]
MRHGALRALERIAQDNPDYRQMVVDAICAYLRTPYSAPAEEHGHLHAPLCPAGAGFAVPVADAAPTAAQGQPHQEHEVRLTAQQILREHLHPGQRSWPLRRPARAFWADIDLDLTGAVLVDLDLSECVIRDARFTGATFAGVTLFRATAFTRDVHFTEATFTTVVEFDDATFTTARFIDVKFASVAGFGKATFAGAADFTRATFTYNAAFTGANFTGIADFTRATFHSNAWFGAVPFAGDATFTAATFIGNAGFGRATFAGDVDFTGATLPPAGEIDLSAPSSWTDFTATTFNRGVPPKLAPFVSPPPGGSLPDMGQ